MLACATTFTQSLALGRMVNFPCNTGHRTPDHIIEACPNFNDLQATRTWSTVTTLQTKPYGSPEDLRKTAAFVQETAWCGHLSEANEEEEAEEESPRVHVYQRIVSDMFTLLGVFSVIFYTASSPCRPKRDFKKHISKNTEVKKNAI